MLTTIATAAHHSTSAVQDLSHWASILAAFASSAGAIISNWNRAKLQAVHVTLNGELHGKLDNVQAATVQIQQAAEQIKATTPPVAPPVATATESEVTK